MFGLYIYTTHLLTSIITILFEEIYYPFCPGVNKKDSYLSTDRPEVRKSKIFQNITKDYQSQNAAGVTGLSRIETARVADKLDLIDQGVYGKKDAPDFIDNVFPKQGEISETEDPNIFKFNPKDKNRSDKFISGGRYYIPILDKFGTYDGNTRQFTIVE